MKQQILKAKGGTIRLGIFANNIELVPSAATVTLYNPDGSVLQAETAASIAASGELSYSLSGTLAGTAKLNYKAAWKYTVSAVDYYENQLFDVVNSILSIPITDDDLLDELDSLRKVAKQERGTATSGNTTTLVDTKRKEEDDFWTGGVLEILSGTNSGQQRTISDFVQSTGTFTVSQAFASSIDSTSVYRCVRSFTNKIRQSFEKMEDMLYNAGRRQDLIIESSQLKYLLIYLTIHFIALDLSDDKEDKWSMLSDSYWKKFQEAFTSLRLEYDENESGNIEGGEEQGARPFELRISRS